MKTKYLISFACIITVFFYTKLNSQDSPQNPDKWLTGGYTALNFNQVSLTNWAKGGENSLSLTAMFNYFFNLKDGDLSWDNSVDFGYGLLANDDYDIRKNDDKIDLSSKFGLKAFQHFYYSALFNLKTQFAPGYNYPNDTTVVSRLFAPAYVIISLGMDYKPGDEFSLYLSPATGRLIMVLDEKLSDIGAYGVDKAIYDNQGNLLEHGKKFKPEFGAYLKTVFKKEIIENITLESKLALFNNFTDKNADNRKNIDVDWETNIMMKINKYIAASIFIHLLYDHDTKVPLFEKINGVKTKIGEGARLQVKEVFGLGFSYKF